MEPLSDRDLDKLLSEWQAPSAPETLTRRVGRARRGNWWKWLLTGSIRVPVPLTLVVAAAFVALFVVAFMRGTFTQESRQPDRAGLQPVKRIEIRVIRSNFENNR
jgi:K+-transporting ATPase A subunit